MPISIMCTWILRAIVASCNGRARNCLARNCSGTIPITDFFENIDLVLFKRTIITFNHIIMMFDINSEFNLRYTAQNECALLS